MKCCILVSAPSFPVDWKTVELPVDETFQPCIAAVISPSLFYLLGPSQGQNTHSCLSCLVPISDKCRNGDNMNAVLIAVFCAVDQQKLRQMMIELASYCSNNNSLSSSSSLSRAVPGAACCAKFSGEEHFLFHSKIPYFIIIHIYFIIAIAPYCHYSITFYLYSTNSQ